MIAVGATAVAMEMEALAATAMVRDRATTMAWAMDLSLPTTPIPT
jgi:hypothetical protein